MYSCKYCDKAFDTSSSLGGHVSSHGKNIRCCSVLSRREILVVKLLEHDEKWVKSFKTCDNCGRVFNAIDGQLSCSTSCSATLGNKKSKRKRGPTKRVVKPSSVCIVCGNNFIKTGDHKTCSRSCGGTLRFKNSEQRTLISKAVTGKTGGWRNFGGNGKKGIYEGYLYQSSWELIWIKYHLERNIPFRRCDEFFEYVFDGKVRKYYPDFFLEDSGEYIEIKGFSSLLTDAKIESVINCGYKITVIGRNEIKLFE